MTPANEPRWTPAQRLAIETRGVPLLVSASAGAGKTAVLTERIVRLVLDPERPVSLDRLLVVTFTRSAAEEMRERIRCRLEARAGERPHDKWLRMQLVLLPRAHITTIDSFCLWLVRHRFSLVDLDPDFRVADEDEIRLLEEEVLDEVFAAAYARVAGTGEVPGRGAGGGLDGPAQARAQVYAPSDGNGGGQEGDLLRLLLRYGGRRDAGLLRKTVLRLYHYARSLPDPDGWLRSLAQGYEWEVGRETGSEPDEGRSEAGAPEGAGEPAGKGWNAAWQREIASMVEEAVAGAMDTVTEALRISHLPAGPRYYEAALTEALDELRSLQEWILAREGKIDDWDGWQARLAGLAFPALPRSSRSTGDDPELRERAKKLYELGRRRIRQLAALIGFSSAQVRTELEQHRSLLQGLIELVQEFSAKLAARKRELNLVDFGDLEHLALDILTRENGNTGWPAVRFDEILIDEYQDINPLQEAVLLAVAGIRAKARENVQGNVRVKSEVLPEEGPARDQVQDPVQDLQATRGGVTPRFLVGDVKQSIYRFRLAEPGIFLRKYREFPPLPPGGESTAGPGGGDGRVPAGAAVQGEVRECGWRVNLQQNFRSRRLILDGVNFLFSQILRTEVGELDYDDEAYLVPGYEYPALSGLPGGLPATGAVPETGGVSVNGAVSESRDTPATGAIWETGGAAEEGERWPIEVHLIEARRDVSVANASDDTSRSVPGQEGANSEEPEPGDEEEGGEEEEELGEEEAAAREAALIATKIKEMVEPPHGRPMPVWDENEKSYRPVRYRDIVVLHRSATRVASILVEMLEAAGVPAYAEVGSGFMRATEIETIRSLLLVLDNPRRDIPLAALLRSPLIGLEVADLAKIRLAKPRGSFWDACRAAQAAMPRVARAVEQIERWRTEARRQPLSKLIWQVYQETGFYYYVAGLPAGEQRQANLRHFYDRARQFDGFARQGLSRFVRFLEQLEKAEVESPEAPILGEADDVVRIMSVHKSKGLEFPVVIVAGIGRPFNLKEVREKILFHQHLGVAFQSVDEERALRYELPPYQAVRHARQRELLAEEMRVLYVALTRARERLILVGSARDLPEKAAGWARAPRDGRGRLPPFLLARAGSYLDWIGPALIHHPDAGLLRRLAAADGEEPVNGPTTATRNEPSRWLFTCYPALEMDRLVDSLTKGASSGRPAGQAARGRGRQDDETAGAVQAAGGEDQSLGLDLGLDRLRACLEWSYPQAWATRTPAKVSVTEWKRESLAGRIGVTGGAGGEAGVEPGSEESVNWWQRGEGRRRFTPPSPPPRFMLEQEDTTVSAAERGTATHLLLQHLDLARSPLDAGAIRDALADLVAREILTREQAAAVSVENVLRFFATDLGQELQAVARSSKARVHREVRFMWGWEPKPNRTGNGNGDRQIIQGTVDCLVERDDGSLLLIDYKTDQPGEPLSTLVDRYRLQIVLYRQAMASIWRRPVSAAYLVFLTLGEVVAIPEETVLPEEMVIPET
ncbi:MAG TPA: UvrD-helicase domain-containing protein [Firmicutes bacterium]|nr:UvrD-helicase domain-containing protein [Bacillota bacterium]